MVKLDEVKLFLKVDHDDEDQLINQMIKSAEEATAQYLNWEETPKVMPSPVTSAILLLIGDLYENRSLQDPQNLFINPTYERLLNPYRMMGL